VSTSNDGSSREWVSGYPQDMKRADYARSGVGFGTALAIAISWTKNGSILWAIFHGLMSWIYVIYHALTR
jgi:hypothetical protein